MIETIIIFTLGIITGIVLVAWQIRKGNITDHMIKNEDELK